jgi:uncharacterized phage infection (PIP) family protein YhgE
MCFTTQCDEIDIKKVSTAIGKMCDYYPLIGVCIIVGGIGYAGYRWFMRDFERVKNDVTGIRSTTSQIKIDVEGLQASHIELKQKVDNVLTIQTAHGGQLKSLKQATDNVKVVVDAHTSTLSTIQNRTDQIKSQVDDIQRTSKAIEDHLKKVIEERLKKVEEDGIKTAADLKEQIAQASRASAQQHAVVVRKLDNVGDGVNGVQKQLTDGVTVAAINPALRASLAGITSGTPSSARLPGPMHSRKLLTASSGS